MELSKDNHNLLQIGILVIVVALIFCITGLTALDKAVPEAFVLGLANLFGVIIGLPIKPSRDSDERTRAEDVEGEVIDRDHAG